MDEVIDNDYIKSQVKRQTCFSQLTEDEMDELSDLFIEKHFAAGEMIVTEGDLVDSVYLIISGQADVQHVKVENQKLVATSIAELGPGAAIGLSESGFYSLSGRRTATVVAKTDMVTLRMSVAAFNGYALSNSHVAEVMRKSPRSV